MRNSEQGPDLYFPKASDPYTSHDNSPKSRDAIFYDTPDENFRNEQEKRRRRHEKEQQIKKRGKLIGVVAATLITAGIMVSAGMVIENSDRNAFAFNQKEHIEHSSILQENNIDSDDIEFGKNNMQFDINNVHYKLMVDVANLDEKGIMNADGGVYRGVATYEENGKEITKTFDIEDKEQNGSLKEGVSIDRALTELGYISKNSENVIE